MAILLDHVIVPSRSPVASARVIAEILGVAWEAKDGHFTPVYVNETLTLDFDEAEPPDSALIARVEPLTPVSLRYWRPVRWRHRRRRGASPGWRPPGAFH